MIYTVFVSVKNSITWQQTELKDANAAFVKATQRFALGMKAL